MSWVSLDLCIVLAVIFPTTFALGQFVATGTSVVLGGLEVVPASTPLWLAESSLGLIALSISVLTLAWITQHPAVARLRDLLGGLGLIAAFALTGIAVYLVVTQDIGSPAIQVTVLLIIVFLYSTSIGLGGHFIAFALPFTANLGFLLASWVLLSASLAWATRKGAGAGLYLLILCTTLAVAAMNLTDQGLDPLTVPLVTLVVIIPLTQAVFLWLSYGLTLWLISQGRGQSPAWRCLLGAADLVLSLLLVVAFTTVLAVILGAAQVLSPETNVDLPSLLDEGVTNPWSTLWLMAICTTLLLPTIVHGTIASLHLITCVPRRWTARFRAPAKAATGAAAALTAATTFICAAFPAALVTLAAQLMWRGGDAVRTTYADALEAIASFAGVL